MKKKTDSPPNKEIDTLQEEARSILKTRARLLAVDSRVEVQQELAEIIVFSLTSETYGLETSCVREVIPLSGITRLPGTPAFVMGIVNVRGQILSVIDLRQFFNLPEYGLGELNKLIILRNDHMEFGILADEIVGILTIELSELQPALPTLTGIREDYLLGITPGPLIILDAKRLLTDKNILVNEIIIE